MAKPKPWSFSALDTFKTCPRQYQAKYVLKSVQEEPTEAILWGNKVHKHFEEYFTECKALPIELKEHEPYLLQHMHDWPHYFCEQKIGFDKTLKPCNFAANDVWYRGIIDLQLVDGENAKVVDYKTGKPHSKFGQLKLFALHTFAMFPDVQFVEVQFYWTKTATTTGQKFTREQAPELWREFIPDLRQYAQAFKEDVWQPRQSGLCKAHCPVFGCEFNGRSR